ncbi:lamin tail domain-containing protein [Gloeobacter morelensis MG652769]|uniref:Lamin tail domain-containing protein n=2 Tax=Gloeobacter TaxID=33071 RepID=A0ABY3PJM8_9CYAN|nr:lamin tail domain-containing protein [Gloeobacter morelensis MG652769]
MVQIVAHPWPTRHIRAAMSLERGNGGEIHPPCGRRQTMTIYQKLWDSDENRFTVTQRNEAGEWADPQAEVFLDAQVRASGKRSLDLAAGPLFAKVEEAKLRLPTYGAFIALLDNYVTTARAAESYDAGEEEEIQNYLETIRETAPVRLAREYINGDLGRNLSEAQFMAALRRIWFELFTNYFQGKSQEYCSGFEHVFVGEAKYDTRFGGAENLGEISGYHNWIKFFLDEKFGRVNFLGYKYDLRGEETPDNPNVVTLQMEWELKSMGGETLARLFKKKGGFFVGTSPECEIAMGTVAFYESEQGLLRQEKRQTTINGARYNLVLYRSTTPQGSRGDFIRSFYPEFLGDEDGREDPMDRTVVRPRAAARKADGPLVIVAALPNPGRGDSDEEWVELQNVSAGSIELTGWQLRDRANRPEPLAGTIAPGETRRILVTRARPDSMQLGNRAGLIALFDAQDALVAAVDYRRTRSGQVLRFEGGQGG